MITEKSVKCKGGINLLTRANGGLAYVPRKKCEDTFEGNKITDGCFVAFKVSSNDNNNTILPRDGEYIIAI